MPFPVSVSGRLLITVPVLTKSETTNILPTLANHRIMIQDAAQSVVYRRVMNYLGVADIYYGRRRLSLDVRLSIVTYLQ